MANDTNNRNCIIKHPLAINANAFKNGAIQNLRDILVFNSSLVTVHVVLDLFFFYFMSYNTFFCPEEGTYINIYILSQTL